MSIKTITPEKYFSEGAERFKKLADEISTKKLVTLDTMLRFLQDEYAYCSVCEADDELFIDASGPDILIRCLQCDSKVILKEIIQNAYSLPPDYLDRMITAAPMRIKREEINGDLWISDGNISEIAGDIGFSYPEREDFEKTTAVSALLEKLDMGKYEEAKVSNTVYRDGDHGNNLVAALESENHVTCIQNKYVELIGGIFKPHISDDPHQPVLVKAHGNLRRIIMPYKFKPDDVK